MDGHRTEQTQRHDRSMQRRMYLRFGAMILTAMVVMYGVMYVSSWEWSHVRFSESRLFMAAVMGGTMGVVMLAWMLNMYRDMKLNVGILAASLLLIALGVFLDRSQTTVQDTGFMSSMIPHHSLAITRAERSELDDVRVCQLAVEISEAQRREILEMDWLIDDIERNGPATTPEEADARSAPGFEVAADRECPAG